MRSESHSPLDDKIMELENELRRVQSDVKSLTKAVHDPRAKKLPVKKSGRVPLRSDKPAQADFTEEPTTKAPSGEPGGEKTIMPHARPRTSERDFRFATYMSAKGLSYGKASRKERNIQRNQAVVMLILVLIALYVVLKLSS